MPKLPGIPEPTVDPVALLATVQALKIAVETLAGQRRGSREVSAVTWDELVRLGVVEQGQVPRD